MTYLIASMPDRMSPHLQDAYAVFAGVAGAFVAFFAVAYALGPDSQHPIPRHVRNQAKASALTLVGAAVSAGFILFEDGNRAAVYASRAVLALVVWPVVGARTWHAMWKKGLFDEASDEYKSMQRSGRRVTFLSMLAAETLTLSTTWIFHRHALGHEDLALICVALLGSVYVAFLAIEEFSPPA